MARKTDDILNTLENIIPKSLDDIIRINRDQCRLAIASETELASLELAEISAADVRHTLSHWQIIMLHVNTGSKSIVSPRLAGRVLETGQSWMTSHVEGVDLSHGLVKTANSTYRVKGERVHENELDLIHICASLNNWGLGKYFGVPEFFY